MDDKKSMFEVPDGLKEPVAKLLNPVTEEIGQSFKNLLHGVIGAKLEYFSNTQDIKYMRKLKQYQAEILDEVNSIPEKRRIKPNFHVAAQALEDSKYCIDVDELRAMFVKLLGKTADSAAQDMLHPSYPDIIKQMSTLDAEILVVLKRNEILPLVNYVSKKEGNAGYQVIQRDVILHELIHADEFHIAMSVSALRRWGIIRVNEQEHLTNDAVYEIFRQSDFFKSITRAHAQYNESVEIQKCICELTSFGRAFAHCCVP